jgi:hypothetical protein
MDLEFQIKTDLAKRFSSRVDLTNGEISKQQYCSADLEGNCGETARITQMHVGGDIRTITFRGYNPQILFKSSVLSSGGREANHSYVVKDGQVWDPILDFFGNVSESDYLQDFQYQ